jgi:hypothetical protein
MTTVEFITVLFCQTVPEDPLRQCQRLPTLRAIQHFEKQSCREAAA